MYKLRSLLKLANAALKNEIILCFTLSKPFFYNNVPFSYYCLFFTTSKIRSIVFPYIIYVFYTCYYFNNKNLSFTIWQKPRKSNLWDGPTVKHVSNKSPRFLLRSAAISHPRFKPYAIRAVNSQVIGVCVCRLGLGFEFRVDSKSVIKFFC